MPIATMLGQKCTKMGIILVGGTKRSMSLFEALFKDVSTRFGRLVIEKCFEKTHRTVSFGEHINSLQNIYQHIASS